MPFGGRGVEVRTVDVAGVHRKPAERLASAWIDWDIGTADGCQDAAGILRRAG